MEGYGNPAGRRCGGFAYGSILECGKHPGRLRPMWMSGYRGTEKYLVQHPYQAKQTGYIQPYADCPLDGIQVGEDVYISIVNKADRYCWFMTPYLIITDEMTQCTFAGGQAWRGCADHHTGNPG